MFEKLKQLKKKFSNHIINYFLGDLGDLQDELVALDLKYVKAVSRAMHAEEELEELKSRPLVTSQGALSTFVGTLRAEGIDQIDQFGALLELQSKERQLKEKLEQHPDFVRFLKSKNKTRFWENHLRSTISGSGFAEWESVNDQIEGFEPSILFLAQSRKHEKPINKATRVQYKEDEE